MPDHGADENPRANPESGPEPEQQRERAPENTGRTENTVHGGVGGNTEVYMGHDVNVYRRSYNGDHHEHHHPPHAIDWPIRVGALPEPAPHFRPREMTGELERTLGQSGTVVLRQVLSGTGGVGKTQLAAHYARTLAQITDPKDQVDVLLWTDASSRDRITSAYAQAARLLHPTVPDEQEEAAKVFLTWLGDPNKHQGHRWLVVWDDLSDPAEVNDLWPPADQPNGRVLVTTRRRDHRLSVQGRKLIDIDVYDSEEARTFLTHALVEAGIPHTDEHMDDLAEALGYLPLALNQAVSYMAELGLDCPAYLELFHDRMMTLAEVFPDWESPTPLATTWDLSLEQADSYAPKGVARPLMGFIALLDGAGIPEDVLTADPIVRLLNPSPPPYPPTQSYRISFTDTLWKKPVQEANGPKPSMSTHQVRAALTNLERLSLISRDSPSNNMTPADQYQPDSAAVRCHQLVQRSTREHRLTQPSYETVRASAEALYLIWPDMELDATLVQRLRANTQVLRSHSTSDGQDTEHWLWEPDGHPVLFRSGFSLTDAGHSSVAVGYWSDMRATSARLLGTLHEDTLAVRANLAAALGASREIQRAIGELEALLPDQIRVQGPDHSRTLAARGELARWRAEAGHLDEAIAELEALIPDQRYFLGPQHPYTLGSRSNLAHFRGEAGQLDQAIPELEELIRDQRYFLSSIHPDTLTTRHTLANYYGEAGDPARATAGLEELIPDLIRVIGHDHPDTLRTEGHLARWHREAGNLDQGAEILENLAGSQLRVLGRSHPDTLETRVSLAVVQYESGELNQAIENLTIYVKHVREVFGDNETVTQAPERALEEWTAERDAHDSGEDPESN